MTDMTLGRWSHVPACVKLLYKLSVSGCLGQPKVSKRYKYNSDFITSGSAALGFEFLGLLKATRSTSFSNFSSDLSPVCVCNI